MSCQPWVDVFIKAAMFRCQGRIPTYGRIEEISRQDPVCTHKLFDPLSDSTFEASRRNKENKLYLFYIQVFVILFVIKSNCRVQPGRKNSRSSIQWSHNKPLPQIDTKVIQLYIWLGRKFGSLRTEPEIKIWLCWIMVCAQQEEKNFSSWGFCYSSKS